MVFFSSGRLAPRHAALYEDASPKLAQFDVNQVEVASTLFGHWAHKHQLSKGCCDRLALPRNEFLGAVTEDACVACPIQ